MTYQQTLDFLYNSLPVFQHVGGSAYKAGFDNIVALEEALGNPHRKIRSVHVAGTNGKGSVSHMVASTLTAAGYRTGLFTSPHLKDFRERIRIDGGKKDGKDHFLRIQYGYHVRGAAVFGWKRGCY